MDAPSHRRFRFPREVIAHCVWLYHRFALSLRDVEELMLERGTEVSHETIHQWTRRFGPVYANALRRCRPKPGDKWHLDEVFVKIQGRQRYLWRAVDQDGNVLDILLQNRRDEAAARRFLRKLMKKTRSVPRVIVTDKLRSHGATHPFVRDVVCVGIPDALLGERLAACVVSRATETLTLEVLCEYLTERGLEQRKHPERLLVVDELPLTPAGKADRAVLRDRMAEISHPRATKEIPVAEAS
ncbi:IS6 family transposase [Streptomyces sp. NPDC056227]|uniref:IS6 family transposase n=1 Tax=Streptomyces sp. NPDC056227 TaxID=3345753 RepID=UPI0035E35CAF